MTSLEFPTIARISPLLQIHTTQISRIRLREGQKRSDGVSQSNLKKAKLSTNTGAFFRIFSTDLPTFFRCFLIPRNDLATVQRSRTSNTSQTSPPLLTCRVSSFFSHKKRHTERKFQEGTRRTREHFSGLFPACGESFFRIFRSEFSRRIYEFLEECLAGGRQAQAGRFFIPRAEGSARPFHVRRSSRPFAQLFGLACNCNCRYSARSA